MTLPVIRLMRAADLGFADRLRAKAGWNQTPRDWSRFLEIEPEGCFVAENSGEAVGTATTACYGSDLAWVGMLLVDPAYRRQGIGSALLEHCLQHLQQRGMGCIKLDATPLGQPVYERLGFVPEFSLTRWEIKAIPSTLAGREHGCSAWCDLDSAAAALLDERAFGHARPRLLEAVRRGSYRAAVHGKPGLDEFGFGCLREGSRAYYLGPVTAESKSAGYAVLKDLLAQIAGQSVFWDALDTNDSATGFAQELGFKKQRSLLRMRFGPPAGTPRAGLQYAIIDPAVG